MFTKKSFRYSLFAVLFFLFSLESQAQCAMCRAVLESEEGGVKAEAINDGIVYLMALPYILVGLVGYAIYKIRTKKN
jgi:hypothetical protein